MNQNNPVEPNKYVNVGGVIPLSTLDYPGEFSAVIFCQGCKMRCLYCHNAHLQPHDTSGEMPFASVMQWLDTRTHLLDAVVFSGGEPTLQPQLKASMEQVKSKGFKIGLHTSGLYPNTFKEVLPYCDWVGLDVKAPIDKYCNITLVTNSGKMIQKSLDALLESNVPFEVRTTYHHSYLSDDDMCNIARWLMDKRIVEWVIQRYKCPSHIKPEELPFADLSLVPDGTVSEELYNKLSRILPSVIMRD